MFPVDAAHSVRPLWLCVCHCCFAVVEESVTNTFGCRFLCACLIFLGDNVVQIRSMDGVFRALNMCCPVAFLEGDGLCFQQGDSMVPGGGG